jgi:DNA-binding NarL/FixJ family response regulator
MVLGIVSPHICSLRIGERSLSTVFARATSAIRCRTAGSWRNVRLDLIREVRTRGKGMPAIALSGYGQLQDVERSREAGFQLDLVKPVEPSRLPEGIQTVSRNDTRT